MKTKRRAFFKKKKKKELHDLVLVGILGYQAMVTYFLLSVLDIL